MKDMNKFVIMAYNKEEADFGIITVIRNVDKVKVTVTAGNENDAIEIARKYIQREHYEVTEIEVARNYRR